MSLLITGGQGFVMSNLVRAWLERHPSERVVVLDVAAPDRAAERYFTDVQARIDWIIADLLDRDAWYGAALDAGIDRIVHGAAVTPHAWLDAAGIRHSTEYERPEHVLNVNFGGTVAVLEFTRRITALQRLVYVSTGSVYGDDGPTDGPLPEEGYVAPGNLYGISKHAGEQATRRYGELFGLSVTATRLASVYGELDRLLPSRHVICTPNRLSRLALAGEPIRLNSTEGVGDYIHAQDVASAIIALLEADRPRHFAYNVASGRAATLGCLAELTASLVPGASWTVDPADPNVVVDPARHRGQWGAYDITRMTSEFGWRPLPLEQRYRDYLAWRRAEERPAAG